MGDHVTSKLNPDSHLILDQPLLRLPFELLRKNFKYAHLSVEKDSQSVIKTLRETANSSLSHTSSSDDVLKSLDSMIARTRNLKRKISACAEEEERLHRQSKARVAHLGDLYTMQSLDDVRYERWSRKRLDRLLVDYMLREGYTESAEMLAGEEGIGELVDVPTFVVAKRIREALARGSVSEALNWCAENKKELRKMDDSLEFDIRFQQYIELLRNRDHANLLNAISHAKKYLLPYRDTHPNEIKQVAGLLALSPGQRMPPEYEELYSPARWHALSRTFTLSHATLLSLPTTPLLHIALSAGLSALKTPSCHSSTLTPHATSNCPICSPELNNLAREVPYAHHTKSHVDADAVVLPNMRVYGRERLRAAGKGGSGVKDPVTGEVFSEGEVGRVYVL